MAVNIAFHYNKLIIRGKDNIYDSFADGGFWYLMSIRNVLRDAVYIETSFFTDISIYRWMPGEGCVRFRDCRCLSLLCRYEIYLRCCYGKVKPRERGIRFFSLRSWLKIVNWNLPCSDSFDSFCSSFFAEIYLASKIKCKFFVQNEQTCTAMLNKRMHAFSIKRAIYMQIKGKKKFTADCDF